MTEVARLLHTHKIILTVSGFECWWQGNPLYGGVQVDEAQIGKGFGWELAWAAHRGDWQRVVALQRWVGSWTNSFRISKNLASVPFVGKRYFAEVYTYSEYRKNRPIAGQAGWPVAGSGGGFSPSEICGGV